jgi:hypothetical protein
VKSTDYKEYQIIAHEKKKFNPFWVVPAMHVVEVIPVVQPSLKNLRIVQLLSSVQVQLNDQQLVDKTILYYHHEHVLNVELSVQDL